MIEDLKGLFNKVDLVEIFSFSRIHKARELETGKGNFNRELGIEESGTLRKLRVPTLFQYLEIGYVGA